MGRSFRKYFVRVAVVGVLLGNEANAISQESQMVGVEIRCGRKSVYG